MNNQNRNNPNLINQNMNNQNMTNQNVVYVQNINEDAPNMKVLKSIFLCLMGILILIEIILEIISFADFAEQRSDIEWSEEENKNDDTSDFTEIPFFFFTFLSNCISFNIMCLTFFNKAPVIKIIAFILLITFKEWLVLKLRDCCGSDVKRHINCKDIFNNNVIGVVISNIIFGIIAISYQVTLKIVTKIPY